LTTTYPENEARQHVWDEWPARTIPALRTYLLLKPGADVEALQAKIHRFAEDNVDERWPERVDFYLQHAPRMHLYTNRDFGHQQETGIHEGPSGRISRLYGLMGIALLVLALACLNYVNLVTSQADVRSREVGLRKVSGASRAHLVTQFLGESFLLTGAALVVALLLVHLSFPYINDILGTQLNLAEVRPIVLLGLAVILVPVVAVLAGGYPALVMSGHEPVIALSGKGSKRGASHRLRRLLIVIQFAAPTT